MSQTANLVDFPRSDEDRLRLALRRLDSALREQKAAVAAFRASVADMREATASLSGEMQRYNAALGETATKVHAARDAARALESRADEMLRQG
ncbi:hypothetical protein [Teichococcus vastitatis]|jgi:chromosome segregation ATPase|uniref:SSNA1 protein n=1 Tax=Teichococcus vastitatis TaxID=2307076 RepID=A0ABS9W7L9_9PROT|nr:hypothetical protein [Pseudoroseomonas vastitatis]MCI0755292.1 hypothetical protein [Pseudoroseomonas vastitatis]